MIFLKREGNLLILSFIIIIKFYLFSIESIKLTSLSRLDNQVWLEIMEDLNEQTELCIQETFKFETNSKSLNKLSATTMLTDEQLDCILEEESNGKTDKDAKEDNKLDDKSIKMELDAMDELNRLDCKFF